MRHCLCVVVLNIGLWACAFAAPPRHVGPPVKPTLMKRTASATFRNPLKDDGADPWMTYYNGWYYLSETGYDTLYMRRARRLADMRAAPDTPIWHDPTPGRDRYLWAPELDMLDSGGHGLRWYLYYTASGGDFGQHRMYVAESAGRDPFGPYTFKARLQTDPDNAQFAIDGSVLKTKNGALYFLWSGNPGQVLYISRMANPWTLTGPRVNLPADGFGCPNVREGPVTLQHGNKVFLVYSMCGADSADYRLGMLSMESNADPMNPASWTQYPGLVLARVDQYQVYAPGHNYFFPLAGRHAGLDCLPCPHDRGIRLRHALHAGAAGDMAGRRHTGLWPAPAAQCGHTRALRRAASRPVKAFALDSDIPQSPQR